MLAFLGFLTIALLLILVMTKRTSPVIALIVVPIVTAVIGGFGGDIATFITDGIKSISKTGVMFIFAILFFGILTDAGTFEPIINRILKVVGKDPVKIAIGTAILAMIVHLDGSGAVTFLVTVPAMLPLYDALGMKRTSLATIVALSAGTMNVLPWGGPTLRAASALDIAVTDLFNPMLAPVLIGLGFVLFIAFRIGRAERARIGSVDHIDVDDVVNGNGDNVDAKSTAKPKLFVFNVLLIIAAISTMISGFLPPHVVFMIAFAVALTVNYPKVKDQRERIDAHAKSALMMASILFAAGSFTGILKGSGMIGAMAEVAVAAVPLSLGKHIPVMTGLTSMPASLLFDPDSFYFGILPVLSSAAAKFGVAAVDVGRAAIIGQMTTGFPVSPLTGSTFLLIGLTGVDLGEHQRKTIPYAFLTTVVMLTASIILGIIPL